MSHTGLYFDGRSAAAHRVEILFEADALVIREGEGELARWPYATLRLIASDKDEVRLAQEGGDARLVLREPEAIAALKTHAPRLFGARRGLARTVKFTAFAAALSAAFIGALYFGLPPLAEHVAPYVPAAVERRLGDNYYAAIEKAWSFCSGTKESAAARATLTALAHRLIAATPVPYDITVDVVDTSMENAFALPGGHILVTRKLIERMDDPDELAGVLAHELGHVIERHGVIGMLQQMGLSLATSLLVGGGSNSGELLVSAGATLTSFAYTRRLEERADQRAVVLLDAARVSPQGFARFFERIEKGEASDAGAKDAKSHRLVLPGFLNTHPPSPARAALARAAAHEGTAPALSPTQWATVKAACGGSEESDEPEEAPPAPVN